MHAFPHQDLTCTINNFSIFRIEEWRRKVEIPTINDDSQWMKLVWIKKGSAVLRNGLIVSPLLSGQICLLNGQGGRKIILNHDTEGIVISFTCEFLNLGDLEYECTYSSFACRALSSLNAIQISENVKADLSELLDRMIKENCSDRLFRSEILIRHLKLFLLYLASDSNCAFVHRQKSKQQNIVERFIGKVEQCFMTQKMVSDYATMFFVTPNYLNDAVKKTTGHSAGYHIRQRVATEAKRMALHSEKSMKEVAYALGFDDPAHFSKFFKVVCGVNFSDFRKNQRVFAIAV